MNKKSFINKLIEFDKKYLKLKYLLIFGIVIGIVVFILGKKFEGIKISFEIFFKYFKITIIPAVQLLIIGYCIFIFLKGGLKKTIDKGISKYGVKNVKHVISQFWLFSIFVPGSGQFLYGFEKRGIFIFIIALFLEIGMIILLSNLTLLFLMLIPIAFWMWNIKDSYKIAVKTKTEIL